MPCTSTASVPVRTEDLTKVYPGGVKAVDTLNLSLQDGEIFGLLGPNGAGKSTTVGMLTTTVAPTSGTARLAGYEPRWLDDRCLAGQVAWMRLRPRSAGRPRCRRP